MNKLSTEKRIAVLSALVEGCSIASTCRMTGAAKMTVLKLLCDVGEACDDLQDRWFRGLECKRLQVDEIWSFVGMKAKNVPLELRNTFGFGDVWTFVAIDADTKLVPCWRLGRRDDLTTGEFMFDLSSRLAIRPQITSDGWGTTAMRSKRLSTEARASTTAFSSRITAKHQRKSAAATPRASL